MSKKPWMTPQVVVLARGTPEEQVLVTCKDGWGYENSPLGLYLSSHCLGKKTDSSGRPCGCCSCECLNTT